MRSPHSQCRWVRLPEAADYYIDNIKINWEVAGEDTGEDNVMDFEGDALGKNYPMINTYAPGVLVDASQKMSTVVADPDGKSGNVLQVGSAESPVNQMHAVVHIKLPEGHKLGDYEMFMCDMKTIRGQYDQE